MTQEKVNNGPRKEARTKKRREAPKKGADIKERYRSNDFFVRSKCHYGNDIITIAPYIPVKIMKVRAEKTDTIKRKDSFSIIKDRKSEIESEMRKEERR